MVRQFKHGGNLKEVSDLYGIPESEIIDFSSNVNPLGVSPKVKSVYDLSFKTLTSYPEAAGESFVEAVSKHHDIPKENILAGAGATELIYNVAKFLGSGSHLIVAPAFSEYERALKGKSDYLLFDKVAGGKVAIGDLEDNLKGKKSFWIANPTNPAGVLTFRKSMEEVADLTASMGVVFVVDEAFIDYEEFHSVKELVTEVDNLIVIRSMTKFFALAGLRAGYLFASKNLIEGIADVSPPWSLGTVASRCASVSFDDSQYILDSIAFNTKEREFLYEEFDGIEGVETFMSSANFILCRTESMKASELKEMLLKEYKVLIRDCSDYYGLDESFFRIAVRGRENNEVLVSALKKCLLKPCL